MVKKQVTHDKEEIDPRHKRRFDILCDSICRKRADKESSRSRPEREDAEKIK